MPSRIKQERNAARVALVMVNRQRRIAEQALEGTVAELEALRTRIERALHVCDDIINGPYSHETAKSVAAVISATLNLTQVKGSSK